MTKIIITREEQESEDVFLRRLNNSYKRTQQVHSNAKTRVAKFKKAAQGIQGYCAGVITVCSKQRDSQPDFEFLQ